MNRTFKHPIRAYRSLKRLASSPWRTLVTLDWASLTTHECRGRKS